MGLTVTKQGELGVGENNESVWVHVYVYESREREKVKLIVWKFGT